MFYYNSFQFYTQKQVDEFKRLENAKLSEWPKGVLNLVEKESEKYGFSGEVLMTSLRNWIVENI